MELLNQIPQPNLIINDNDVIKNTSHFIEANTIPVSLEHLKNDCIIPVFSKDNESTISHYEFVNKTVEVTQQLFPDAILNPPEVRVSHIVKGRIPSAVGKPAKELQEHEKTIYYERCAFVIEIPQISEIVNGNKLNLTIGGVRSLSHENLYAKKSLEKFKVFIGFQNKVCTNLCVSTDGYANDIRIGSILELEGTINHLALQWDKDKQLGNLERMSKYELSNEDFAHLVGKLKMYQHLPKEEQQVIFPVAINDNQINSIIKDYFNCENFSRMENGSINLWNVYNLITGANKSSYIDSFIDRGLFAYQFTQDLCKSIQNQEPNWYLNNLIINN
jgi:hypothetical protein